MKNSLIIAARNFARLIPVTAVSCFCAYAVFNHNVWATGGIGGFFLAFWAISTASDISYRNTIIRIRQGKGHDSNR